MGCGARKYCMCKWVVYKWLPFKNMCVNATLQVKWIDDNDNSLKIKFKKHTTIKLKSTG